MNPLLLVSFPLLLTTIALAQDSRAFAESMFVGTGPAGTANPCQLWCASPPQLGSTAAYAVAAPGRVLAGVLVGTGATTGAWLPTPCGHPVLLYVDWQTQLGMLTTTLAGNGQGSVWLAVPWSTGLVGFDLHCQAWAASAACDLVASNLVASNVGTAANQGNAVLAQLYGPLTLPALTTWSLAGAAVPVVTNMTSGNLQPYRLLGSKTPGVGPLQLVDALGVVVAQAAASATSFTLVADTAPNRRLFWRNAGSAPLTVQWRLSALWF